MKISNKNFSSFFTGKSLYNFSKKLLLRPFFKNSLQEGVFENSLKFLQLVPNLTPIRKLLCTFLYQCCYYSRPPLTYPNIKRFKGPKMDSLHFSLFHFSLFHFSLFTSLHFTITRFARSRFRRWRSSARGDGFFTHNQRKF